MNAHERRIWRVEYFWRNDPRQVLYATYYDVITPGDARGLFDCEHEDDDVQVTRVSLAR